MTEERKTLHAILNQLSGLSVGSLSELKNAVEDEVRAQMRRSNADGTLTEEEWSMVRNSNLIDCVKSVRERTGLGIRDAKDYMDRARGKG